MVHIPAPHNNLRQAIPLILYSGKFSYGHHKQVRGMAFIHLPVIVLGYCRLAGGSLPAARSKGCYNLLLTVI